MAHRASGFALIEMCPHDGLGTQWHQMTWCVHEFVCETRTEDCFVKRKDTV